MNITPVFNFLTQYSRKSRLKVLLGVVGIIFLCIVLTVVSILSGATFLIEILVSCIFYGILAIPFLLLALIPKQQTEKLKRGNEIQKAISVVRQEYKRNQKNLRPATRKERLIFGGILIVASLICFYMGSIAIVGGIFWLAMAFCCFCSRIPIRVQDKNKIVSKEVKPQKSRNKRTGKNIFMGIAFVGIGFLVMTLLTVGKFTCSKMTGECEIQAQHIWEWDYKTKSKLYLNDLLGASVESQTSHDDEGDSTTYYVVLQTNFGNQRLFSSSSSSYSTHEKRANQINQFLYSNQEALEIKESKVWLFLPLIFIVFGGWMLFSPLTFSREKSKISSSKKTTKKLKKKGK
ncbi:MAG: hypothetical protein J6T55_03520 [Alphaproteobacteria bacterium]|nr:hypothetical protein [Alphaproteobacteria bacterium]